MTDIDQINAKNALEEILKIAMVLQTDSKTYPITPKERANYISILRQMT